MFCRDDSPLLRLLSSSASRGPTEPPIKPVNRTVSIHHTAAHACTRDRVRVHVPACFQRRTALYFELSVGDPDDHWILSLYSPGSAEKKQEGRAPRTGGRKKERSETACERETLRSVRSSLKSLVGSIGSVQARTALVSAAHRLISAAIMQPASERPTLVQCDEHGRFYPGTSGAAPTKRLGAMLWHLCARGDASRLRDVVQAASQQGLDFSHRAASGGGASALFVAALAGHKSCVQLLLEHRLPYTPRSALDAADAHGNTALIAAAARGKKACVALLLQHGASPNWRNIRGYSALDAALDFARTDCVSLLLQAGATPPPAPKTQPRRQGAAKVDWDRGLSAQRWWQEATLPGQGRRARELAAQLKAHEMVGPDATLLESPIDRYDLAQAKHARELDRSQRLTLTLAERSLRRDQALHEHRERLAQASLAATGGAVAY